MDFDLLPEIEITSESITEQDKALVNTHTDLGKVKFELLAIEKLFNNYLLAVILCY